MPLLVRLVFAHLSSKVVEPYLLGLGQLISLRQSMVVAKVHDSDVINQVRVYVFV